MKRLIFFLLTATFALAVSETRAENPMTHSPTPQIERATLAGGCFWCMEAQFKLIPGVVSVTSGYAGGATANPTYEEVCTGTTGYAEVIQIAFDPHKLSYSQLLQFFWAAHDPTTLDRQGPDHGTQYRSIILTENAAQKKAAEASEADEQKKLSAPIVTEIVPLKHFYTAEKYHQNYFANHPGNPYCSLEVLPKVEKFQKFLTHWLAEKKSNPQ